MVAVGGAEFNICGTDVDVAFDEQRLRAQQIWRLVSAALGISAVAASYGLFKLKQWGAASLGIMLPCVGIAWLISATADAFHDAAGASVWLGLLVLFGGIVWYLSMRATKVAFGGTAQRRG